MKKIIYAIATFFVLTYASAANAAITDGKFGTGQMFDVQYYWSGTTLHASSFTRIFGSSGQLSVQEYTDIGNNNQYFGFFNSTTHPGQYGLAVYNSDGTVNRVLHTNGTITALGADAIFYLGSGFYGTVIPTSQGYSLGASASFTSMDTNVDSNDLNNYTFASSTPLAAGQSAAPATPTLVSINNLITTVFPTSNNSPAGENATKAVDGNAGTKYLNFDRESAGFTVQLSQGRVVKGLRFTTANDFELRDPTKFTLMGSNDGVNWTPIAQGQAISLPSGRGVTTSDITVTNTNAYVYYFITFPELKSSTDPSCANPTTQSQILACDSVQIGEVTFLYENGDTTTSSNTGTGTVTNPDAAPTPVYLSSITASQTAQKTAAYAVTTGNNIELTIIGNSNDVDITQLSDGNYLEMDISGNTNTADITQSGTNLTRNFADIDIDGSTNDLTVLQEGASEKVLFLDINGSFGTFDIIQKETGSHYLDLSSTGNDAIVTVLQEGQGNHSATIDLVNSGGNWDFTLTQSGDVDQLFSLPHNLSDNTVVSGNCYSSTCTMVINQQ